MKNFGCHGNELPIKEILYQSVFGDKYYMIGHKFTISVTMDVSPFAWCLGRAVLNVSFTQLANNISFTILPYLKYGKCFAYLLPSASQSFISFFYRSVFSVFWSKWHCSCTFVIQKQMIYQLYGERYFKLHS